jgi:hypothetical protein
MRITKKNIRKLLIELSREYDVKIYFNIDYDFGSARYWNNSISVSYRQSATSMLSTFFHELGHIYCWNNGLWKSFHINKAMSELTPIEKQKYTRVALKAERWVDGWARKEMKKHFPNIKYVDSYFSEQVTHAFKKQIKKELYDVSS